MIPYPILFKFKVINYCYSKIKFQKLLTIKMSEMSYEECQQADYFGKGNC